MARSKNRYDYGLFDAQLILVRTMKALMGRSPGFICIKEDVMRTFLYSIFKVVREVGIGRPVLLWDSSPYHKSTIMRELLEKAKTTEEDGSHYKSDRKYYNADDLANLSSEIDKLMNSIEDGTIENNKETQERLEKLQAEMSEALIQVSNYNVRQDIKFGFIDDLRKFGMSSVIKKGWEADDLAYLLGQQVHERGKTALLVTVDTDWDYWTNPSVDKYNNYSRKFVTEAEVRARHHVILGKFPEISTFKMKTYIDTILGSHNNLLNTVKDEWKGRALEEIIESLPESVNEDLFNAQLATWDFSKYPDYDFISKCLDWYLKDGTISSKDDYVEYMKLHNIKMNPNKYTEMVGFLDGPRLYGIESENVNIGEYDDIPDFMKKINK